MRWSALTLALMSFSACSGGGLTLTQARGTAMGTEWSVKVVTEDSAAPTVDTVQELTTTQLDQVDSRMSTYLASSEVSMFNASAGTAPFPISPETAEVLRYAIEIGSLTGGALDVTVGPLVDVWGFGSDRDSAEIPSDRKVNHLLSRVGQKLLRFDSVGPTITKTNPELRIDLSAIAKGYAVDRVADALIEASFENLMVEIGGEIRVLGHNADEKPWRLAVERPNPDGRSIQRILTLRQGSLATSGDYRQYREIDGHRFSHIIDPRTGRPVEHRPASVTVIADLCVRADAFATALFVLGPVEGMLLAEKLGLAALFLVRDEDGRVTESASSTFLELAPSELDHW
ncbi:MAG: FAD:protein FMN transferase [bacterium]|nr:FAD:protein FMN transferase [bacterium]